MKQIKISYQPAPFLPVVNTAQGSYPESWNEITPIQVKTIAQALTENISNHEFLHVFTGIKKRILKKLDDYQQFKLLELVEFVNKIEPYNSFIIDQIRIDNELFCSPKPMLKGVTFGQFIFADSFFRNYSETKNPEEMNRFLATLYLSQGKVFKEKYIEQNSSLMGKADRATRDAIHLNYILIFEWLMDLYPLVFPRDPGVNNPDPGNKIKQRDPRAWIKIFESLVGDDIIHQNKYANLPVHHVFRYFTKNIKDNMKRKKTPKH